MHAPADELRRLLEGSVTVWRIEASVEPVSETPATVLVRTSGGRSAYVTRQDGGDLPPCWEIRRAGSPPRTGDFGELPVRRYAAVPGMLRRLRAALDPDARGGRLVIGPRQA